MIHDAQSSDIMATNAERVEVAVTVTEPAEFDKLKGKVLQNLNEMIASVTNVLCNQPLEFDRKKFVHSNQNTVKQPTFLQISLFIYFVKNESPVLPFPIQKINETL